MIQTDFTATASQFRSFSSWCWWGEFFNPNYCSPSFIRKKGTIKQAMLNDGDAFDAALVAQLLAQFQLLGLANRTHH
jgi:hypothetical protein